ncbi:MAG: 2-keto-4-pentenoate hydratase/2-oxohepta-3-ene-1,7-dioic acid hydratase in catechol pathway [Phycisphaerales bacterium]|jgi:2-keto-4-pentenoate hydratase/2-oxohepta-3-ene-1,7-dioic acid hydratase in catechol pathway
MELVKTEFGVGVDRGEGGVLELRHIIGIGRNYAEHAREQGADLPTRPMVFTKNPGSACLSGDEIVIPPVCGDADTDGHGGQVDFEAELAVIIGTAAKDVREEDALSHVLGYCCGNDVSARWWQKKGSGGQFCRGKSFDTFCPLGPRVVADSEAGGVQNLRVVCRVNGETMQDGNTSQMIFPVARLISDLSRGTTLMAGTVIMTGTPSGVGMARDPQVWLKAGDVVEVEIEGLGVLRNGVVRG